MTLTLYNTMTGQKELFQPSEAGRVKLYVCGPTVYDHSHIGHARAVVVFDVLVRHFQTLGYEVTYIRNFTDLDDKIIKRSQEQGIDYLELAEHYMKSFHEDMDALGALRPTLEPRATELVPEMIEDIQAIMAAGCAYQADGDVYFDVTSFPEYGRLSKRNLEDMQAGARIEVNERKRNPWDFALWKKSKPGEPAWPSPWGRGRPGWHIECSTMSERYLGAEFDIHGGGQDLIFPHHENEIAQSAALGRKFARVWVHNGFVQINEQKMSKSLGNFFTVKEVLKEFHPEVLRLFLLSKHYRSPIDFSPEAMREAARSLERVYRALQGVSELGLNSNPEDRSDETSEMTGRFTQALDDDLNTARALGCLFEAVRELNRLLDLARDQALEAERLQGWSGAILRMGRELGLLAEDPAQAARSLQPQPDFGLSQEKIEAMLRARAEARARKDWAEADRIRAELKASGVILEDKAGQTTWRFET